MYNFNELVEEVQDKFLAINIVPIYYPKQSGKNKVSFGGKPDGYNFIISSETQERTVYTTRDVAEGIKTLHDIFNKDVSHYYSENIQFFYCGPDFEKETHR